MFIQALKNEFNNELSVTENGAVGYATTGKKMLDMFFKLSSYRNRRDSEIISDFLAAWDENSNKVNAILFLFFVRDIRGGAGERRVFNLCFNEIIKQDEQLAVNLLPFIAEYGRWSDIFEFTDSKIKSYIFYFVNQQFKKDLRTPSNESISLLAKWMPSENCSNLKRRKLATALREYMGLTSCNYRKYLSHLRKRLDIVERKMSAKQFSDIDYEKVPSRASFKYKNAFANKDGERWYEFLEAVKNKEKTIHAGTLFPHEIVAQYDNLDKQSQELEAFWNALPEYVENMGNTLVVRDGSGSMTDYICNTSISFLNVADALTIYFSSRASGAFKNRFITFSSKAQLVELKEGSLYDKLHTLARYDDCSNTNVKSVFDIVLKVACDNKLEQKDLPERILVMSDMEFDCMEYDTYDRFYSSRRKDQTPLFENIKQQYAEKGYKLPRLVFWNICGRTDTIPVKENENGVALVSGFSPAIAKMVLSNKLDPYDALLEMITGERYQPIAKVAVEYLVSKCYPF